MLEIYALNDFFCINNVHIYNEDIARQEYDWGDRLSESEASNPNEVGMVRMADEAGKKRGKPTGTYFTFRVISANSKADWRIRKEAVKPNRVTQALEASLREQINGMIQDGIEMDMGS